MSDNPLSRKVELDLTNYKAGIAEMNRSIRVIESGFRASAAALGDWSKDASGLEQRVKALNGTIDIQRQKVDALRAVYEQVVEEQGANSRAAQSLEVELNKATEALGKMESELSRTGSALAEMNNPALAAAENISDLDRMMRLSEAEFKAAAAGIKDWDKNANLLEMRITSLSDQVKAQQEIVGVLRDEYERIASEQGETSAAALEAEIAWRKQQTALGELWGELEETKTTLEDLGQEEENVQEVTEDVAEAEEDAAESTGTFADRLDDLKSRLGDALGGLKELGGKVLSAVKTGLLAAGAAAVGAVTGLTALVLKSAASADELVELSDKTGLSVEQLQELQYIGEQTGTSMETVTGSLAKLVRSMAGAAEGTGAAAGAFEQLGVPVTDVNGELRDSQAVFGDVLDALQAIENPTERDALAMEIFGKSAQELNPLIDAGSEGMADMADEANNLGAVMSGDTVNGLAALNDMVAGLKLGFQGWIGQLAGAFLPLFQTVIGAVQGFVSNPEVQAGLQNIIGKVAEFAQKLADAAALLLAGDLKGALGTLFPPEVAEQILNISTQLGIFIGQVVEFVTTHAEAIKNAFIAIGVVLAGAGIVAALSAILNPITLIIAAVGLLAAAWTEDFLGIRTALEGWWNDSGQQIFETLKTWLETNIPIALQTLSDFWTGTLQPALEQVWGWMKENLFPLLADLVTIYFNNVQTGLEVLGDFWENTLQPAMETVWDWMQGTLFPLLDDLWAWLEETIPAALETLAGFWEETLQPAMETVWGFIQDDLMPLFEDLQELFDVGLNLAITAITGLWDTLYDSLYDVWEQVKIYLKPALDGLEAFFGGLFKDTLGDVSFLDVLTTAFDTLGAAIKGVRDFIQGVITKLKQMGDSLPEWAVPGSPMPLDYAFRDLGSTLDDLSKNRLSALQRGLATLENPLGNLTPGPSPAGRGGGGEGGGGGGGTTTIYQLSANYAYESPRSLMAEVKLRELLAR